MLILFFLVWLIFNGAITTEIVVFGIVISLVMFAFICKCMDYSLQKEKKLLMRSGYFLLYVLILIKEVLKANMEVVRMIISRDVTIQPTIVSFHTSLKSRFCRAILANTITLTPGTITVSLEDNELIVHCLDKSLAEGMDASVFVEMLEKLERIGE